MLNKLLSFLRSRDGNVSMMFGLAVVPLLGAVGAAIDYSRISSSRSVISAAADAGSLAGAGLSGTAADREAAARAVFVSNLQRSGYPHPVTVRYVNQIENGRNAGFRIEADSVVPSLFGWALGTSNVPVNAVSQARSGAEIATELAFVLDTTASMEGDRIANLKSAAVQMIDDISSRTMRPDLFKVGIVPFAQYVNVGLANRNAAWINVPADYQTPVNNVCGPVYDVIGTTNCRMVSYPAEPYQPPGTCIIDGRPRQCGGSPGRPARTENVCDNVYSTTPRNVCWTTGGDWVRWDGCVGSRNYPLETRDSDYGNRIPGIMGVSCASPIQELTANLASIRSSIQSLGTMGETYLPAGLIWGKRMLSPGEPLNASSDPNVRKIMVIVTDGKNTKSPTYPNHDGSDEASANQLTRETCQNIAADRTNPVRIFTIAFEMDGLETKSILQACAAASGGQFFDAADPVRLRQAFAEIANSITNVRLTQ